MRSTTDQFMHTRMWQTHSVNVSYQAKVSELQWLKEKRKDKLPWDFTFYIVQHGYRLNANSAAVITYLSFLSMVTSFETSPWHSTMTTSPTPTTFCVSTASCIILHNLFTVCCQNGKYWFKCSLSNCQFLLVYVPEWKRKLHFLLPLHSQVKLASTALFSCTVFWIIIH